MSRTIRGLLALAVMAVALTATSAASGACYGGCGEPTVVESGPYLKLATADRLSWRLAHQLDARLPAGTSDVQVGACSRVSRRHVDCALSWRQNGCDCHLISHVTKSRRAVKATTHRRDYYCTSPY